MLVGTLFIAVLFTTFHQSETDKRLLDIDQNEWMWLSGSNLGNQVSSVRKSDVPELGMRRSASEESYPGSRGGSAAWKDRRGNLWMFGGRGYDHYDTETAHNLNDLWMYNSTSHRWTLVHPGANASQPKTGQRQLPSPRWGATACGVDGIILMVFGGESAQGSMLFDTWLYEIKKKKWLPLFVKTAEKDGRPTHPEGRTDMTSWCNRDKLVIFGGLGNKRVPLDNMWVFSLRTLQWNKVTQVINSKEVLDSPVPVVFPEHRTGAASWVGARNMWYMFGGNKAQRQYGAFENHEQSELINDVWSFQLARGNVSKRYSATWTHLHSDTERKSTPSARQHSTPWVDYRGDLWMFAGQSGSIDTSQFRSDTWKYHPTRNTWSLEHSPLTNNSRVPIKSKGHLLPGINPTARCHAVGWTFKNVTYVFGGYGLDARGPGKTSYLNDMWAIVQPFTDVPQELFAAEGGVKERNWLHNLPAATVFWICLGTFGGLALVFGTGFFLKKMLIDYPRHNPNSGFNVRYSPLKDEANFEMW